MKRLSHSLYSTTSLPLSGIVLYKIPSDSRNKGGEIQMKFKQKLQFILETI